MPTQATAAKPPKAPEISPSKGSLSLLVMIGHFGLALLVVALALEFIFFLAGVGDQAYLKPDKTVGFSPMAGKVITWRKEGYCRTLFNSFGMREREIPTHKRAGTFRIAVLGDSYVEALQVADEKTFCRQLENALNAENSSVHFEVLNFGVSAYNLGQMYLRLRHLALKFEPDLVLVTIRPDSTVQLPPRPNMGMFYARPTFFRKEDGSLIEDLTVQDLWLKSAEAKRMRATSWLREHSRIWGAVGAGLEHFDSEWKRIRQQLSDTASSIAGLRAKNALSAAASASTGVPGALVGSGEAFRQATIYMWPVADSLLAAMKSDCLANHGQLAVVRLPINGGRINNVETALIIKSCRDQSIPFVDLTPLFQKRDPEGKKLFYAFHYAEAGHALVSAGLLDFLVGRAIVPQK